MPDLNSDLELESLFRPLEAMRGLLLAVSGGPDSLALLVLIDRWRRGRAIPVAVATVDHRLREGAAGEAQAVAAVCAARRLPHRTLVRAGGPLGARMQERAREARYALLAECAGACGAEAIVTAHHADDQAETILMRLLRGSGPAGLAGMAPLAPLPVGGATGLRVARPLLEVPKTDLVAICRAEGLVFADDPSNSDPRFRRGALRALGDTLAAQGLTPDALRRLGRRAARAEAALAAAADCAFAQIPVARDAEAAEVSRDIFDALPDELRLRWVGHEIARLDGAPRLERLEALLRRLDAAPSLRATLAGALVDATPARLRVSRAPPRRA